MIWRTKQCGKSIFFFFNDTATTEIYTLSLHDALPICHQPAKGGRTRPSWHSNPSTGPRSRATPQSLRASSCSSCRSEEHTSELQSRLHLVCRLLLEKKNDVSFSTDYPSVAKEKHAEDH